MQAGAQIVHAGGVTVSPGGRSTMCRAFKAAAKAWCEDKGNRNGRFNDYFFGALEDTPPNGAALAENMEREVPALVDKDGEVRLLEDFTGQGGAFGEEMREIADVEEELRDEALRGERTWDSYRGAMNCAMYNEGVDAKYRYPDAMVDDQVVEIKGPGDEFGDGQLRDYQKINPNKPVLEVSCESCGAACADGNKC